MVPEVIIMNDDKKSHLQKEGPSKFQRLLRKRWFYPALYLGVAAIVIASVLWMQTGTKVADQDRDETAHNYDEEAIPTAQQQEVFVEPVLAKDVEVRTPFYDVEASAEDQESALVFYNNKYHQNQGIDYALKSGEAFDVTASLSGTVTKAEKDALLGHVIELKHSNGVTTVYHSLANIDVKEGDKVEQGDVLGEAGKSTFNKEAGIHAHFEIRKDGVAVNPLDYFGKSATSIPDREEAEKQEAEKRKSEQKEAQESEEAEQQEDTTTDSDEESEAKQKDATRSMTNA